MTPRAVGLVAGGAALLLLGRLAGWPELSALGGAALALVVLALLLAARGVRAEAWLGDLPRSVTRGAQAGVHVGVAAHRRASLRLVLGPPAAPLLSVPVRGLRADEPREVVVPLDTSVRGMRPAGPYALVRSDPWGLVRRVVATVDGAPVTVHPRTAPVERVLLSGTRSGDSDVSTRRPGSEHFHALREYVLGDEPRAVHWRSSARAGRLVVRQSVSAAADAVVVLLDVDSAAYGSGQAFAARSSPERFEAAVDVAASLASASRASSQVVHVSTTARSARAASAGAATAAPLLDALALVHPLAPVDVAPEQLRPSLRRLSCARLLVVTGDPDPRLVTALQALGRDLPVLLVRTGGTGGPPVPGVRTLDVAGPDDLSARGAPS